MLVHINIYTCIILPCYISIKCYFIYLFNILKMPPKRSRNFKTFNFYSRYTNAVYSK